MFSLAIITRGGNWWRRTLPETGDKRRMQRTALHSVLSPLKLILEGIFIQIG